ncbi:hypothetical protein ABJY87_14095, partial [Vibrio parahaemolyticus]
YHAKLQNTPKSLPLHDVTQANQVGFLMSHTLLGVTEFNGSFSGKQKGMRDASLCYFCLIKSEIKL